MPQSRKIDWTDKLITAVMTVMTAAILGIFSKVSDLAETTSAMRARLDHEVDDRREMRTDVRNLGSSLEESRLEIARVKTACDEWMRKMQAKIDRRG